MTSNYEHAPYSARKDGTDANTLFDQLDVNRDGVIDRAEFANLVGSSDSGIIGTSHGVRRVDDRYGLASYDTSRFSSGVGLEGTGYGGHYHTSGVGLEGTGYGGHYHTSGVGLEGTGYVGHYHSSGVGLEGTGYGSHYHTSGVGLEGIGYGGHYHSSYELGGGLDAIALKQAAGYTADSNSAWSRYGAEVRGIGLFYDHNPEIIRRAGHHHHGHQTYTQNVHVRFLQPPPVPPSGPLIIKEVRPPQPPPLPPLRIKQYERAVAQLPPLVLRERPPQPPIPLPAETVVRHLPALPVPPRSVIIERYAAVRARPRDIIIERWLPYAQSAARKTIVQRAEAAISYAAPRNVIIEYTSGEAHVVRQFKNLGVYHENPRAYLARYGEELLDSHTLIHRAHAAGVFEDISTPAAIRASGFHSLTYNTDGTYHTGGEAILGSVVGEDLGGVSTAYSTTGFERLSTGGAGACIGETHVVEGGGVGGTSGFRSSSYESSSYSSGGGVDAASAELNCTETK